MMSDNVKLQDHIDLVNGRFPKHKFASNQVVAYVQAKRDITPQELPFRIFFGLVFIFLSSPFFFFSGISIKNILTFVPVIFFLVGVMILIRTVSKLLLKPYFILTNKHLYKFFWKKVISYNWSRFIKDVHVQGEMLRLKYRKHSRFSFENVHMVGIEDVNKIALLIWSRLNKGTFEMGKKVGSKGIQEIEDNFRYRKGKSFEVQSEKFCPWTYSIIPIIVGSGWILFSPLFIYGGILGTFDMQADVTSRPAMFALACIGTMFFVMGFYILFKSGVWILVEKGFLFVGLHDGLCLFKQNQFRLISWQEVLGTSWVEKKMKYFYLRIKASLTMVMVSRAVNFRPDHLFIYSKTDLSKVREAIRRKIKG